jgi:hypothetical protein
MLPRMVHPGTTRSRTIFLSSSAAAIVKIAPAHEGAAFESLLVRDNVNSQEPTGEQYGNIEEAKPFQMVPLHPK